MSDNVIPFKTKPNTNMDLQQFYQFLEDNKHQLRAFSPMHPENKNDGIFDGWTINENQYKLVQKYKVTLERADPIYIQHFNFTELYNLMQQGKIVFEIVK